MKIGGPTTKKEEKPEVPDIDLHLDTLEIITESEPAIEIPLEIKKELQEIPKDEKIEEETESIIEELIETLQEEPETDENIIQVDNMLKAFGTLKDIKKNLSTKVTETEKENQRLTSKLTETEKERDGHFNKIKELEQTIKDMSQTYEEELKIIKESIKKALYQ